MTSIPGFTFVRSHAQGWLSQMVASLIILAAVLSPTSLLAVDSPSEANKAVATRAFLELLNKHDFTAFEEIHTKDFVKHYSGNPAETLSQEMVDAKGQFLASSDLVFSINWLISEGDKVAVCFTANGTHDGPFKGIPATGKKYAFTAMTVWRVVNGKLAEEWVFSNDMDLYRQLGLLSEASGGNR